MRYSPYLLLLLLVGCYKQVPTWNNEAARESLTLANIVNTPKPVHIDPIPQPKEKTYAELLNQSLRSGIPIVVAIGYCPPLPGEYLCICGQEFAGEARGIIVGIPINGSMRRYDLPATANVSDIRKFIEDTK